MEKNITPHHASRADNTHCSLANAGAGELLAQHESSKSLVGKTRSKKCWEPEYPEGSGKWLKGSHKPLLSKDLYDLVQEVRGIQNVLHARSTRRGLVQATLRYRGEGDQCQPALPDVSLFPRSGWYRSAEPMYCVTHQRSLQLLAACRIRVR
jgi:hypothetical protein